MSHDIATRYAERYERQSAIHLYPVEFVVRAFLGTYPGLKMDRTRFQGSRIVDLGYGDGRNMPLLQNLGFEIFGVEIHEHIRQSTQSRLRKAGVHATLCDGTNAAIPFPDNFFHFALACHAFYYVEPGGHFTDNLREVYRVMTPGATFVLSLPMTDGYLLQNAEPCGDGHVRIGHDPCGLRAGTVFRLFGDRDEIVRVFAPWFENIQIG